MRRDRPSGLFFATNNASRSNLGSNFPAKHIGNLLRIWKLGLHVFEIPAKLALSHPIHVSPQTARSRPEYSAERVSAQRPFDSPPRCTPRERAERFYESQCEEQSERRPSMRVIQRTNSSQEDRELLIHVLSFLPSIPLSFPTQRPSTTSENSPSASRLTISLLCERQEHSLRTSPTRFSGSPSIRSKAYSATRLEMRCREQSLMS